MCVSVPLREKMQTEKMIIIHSKKKSKIHKAKRKMEKSSKFIDLLKSAAKLPTDTLLSSIACIVYTFEIQRPIPMKMITKQNITNTDIRYISLN